MEVLYKGIVNQITERSLTLQLEDGSIVYYKEWVNDSGKVIDCTIRSKDGYDISLEDPGLFDKVCEYVDYNVTF
jgi:hypothetical protein